MSYELMRAVRAQIGQPLQAVIVHGEEKDRGFAELCAKFEEFGPLIVHAPAPREGPVEGRQLDPWLLLCCARWIYGLHPGIGILGMHTAWPSAAFETSTPN